MLEKFENMVIKVEKELSAKLNGFEKPIDDFGKYEDLVTTCLKHGIVPSTVYKNGQGCHPNPTTILNSGFFFYLEDMDSLLKIIESSDDDIDKRINYEKRLNQWLSKAIEDWQVLSWENKL
jgi:hypothetical protein